jgi:hypothetical protein
MVCDFNNFIALAVIAFTAVASLGFVSGAKSEERGANSDEGRFRQTLFAKEEDASRQSLRFRLGSHSRTLKMARDSARRLACGR